MSGDDKLDWIWSTPDEGALIERYDAWAASYDDDHDLWGWDGPMDAVEALLAHMAPGRVLDAGCGTGRVGAELRNRAWAGHLIGVDISFGMIGRAVARGYDELVQASLHAIPIDTAGVDAIVSAGVFTHGHVGHEAFPELIRVTAPGGTIVITSREEVWEAMSPHAAALEAAGAWSRVARTEPRSFHPQRAADGRPQSIIVWQVH